MTIRLGACDGGGVGGDEGGEVGKPGVESSVQQTLASPQLLTACKVQNSSSLDFRELRVTAGQMPSVVCESNSCEIIF